MKIRFCLLFLLFALLAGGVVAQNTIDVTGVVHDEDGESIIGATVKVKGTSRGTVTDIDGKFKLPGVKAGEILQISFVGYASIEEKAARQMNIVLHSVAEQLEEVIVTAFGTAKRSAFTGSATVLNSDKLEQKQVTNVMSSLIGEVPGLQIAPSTSPGSTSSILIRGEGSINADNDPLIVLDGMPYDGLWNDINPQDVESVTVLKDAASNALYGARGANGVIIVTTKKGSKGKATVTLNAKWGVNQRSVPDYDRVTNPGEYYELYYKALYNYSVGEGNSSAAAHKWANETLFLPGSNGGLGYNVYTVPENEYLIGTNGKLNPNATLGRRIYKDGEVYTLYPDDWTDALYRNGLRQEYNLSISGGTEQASVYGSFGYLNDEGIVDASGYERLSGRLRASYQANKWLSFGGNIGLVHSSTKTAYSSGSTLESSVFSSVANIAPIYPLYVRDRDGEIMYDRNGKMYDWGNGLYNDHVRPHGTNYNSIQALGLDFNESNGNAVNGDAFIDISFLKHFKLTLKGGTSVRETRSDSGANPYYGYSSGTGGSLTKSSSRRTTYNLQQLLNWNRAFGPHNLSALIGHEFYNYRSEYLEASKVGAVNYDGNKELNGYLTSPDIPESYNIKYNREGYFLRAMYDYDERYFFQASFRRDASSRFHPDNRWGNFWSVGGAWIISKENWFAAGWVDNLKLKISYGEQGNDQLGSSVSSYYRYVDTYTINNVNGEVSLAFNTKGNKGISWETSRNFNMGIEFDLFRNRLNGGVEYYNRLTGDMLHKFTTPETLGYGYYWKNIGDLRNRGVEVTLSGSPVRTRKIEWSLNLNLTYNKQEITYLPEENKGSTPVEGYYGYKSGDSFIAEGLSLNTWYIPKFAGVTEDGLAQWYRTDGNGERTVTTDYNSATRYIIKADVPLYGGFGTSLKLWDFDIAAQFTCSLGGKAYDWEYSTLMTTPVAGSSGHALHKDLWNSWSPENPTSDIPVWKYGEATRYAASTSDRFLTNSSYLAFQNFQVGYTFPKLLVRKMGLQKLRVYVTGDNLCLWSKRKGFDPRLSTGYGSYSPMRTISGGITLQF